MSLSTQYIISISLNQIILNRLKKDSEIVLTDTINAQMAVNNAVILTISAVILEVEVFTF